MLRGVFSTQRGRQISSDLHRLLWRLRPHALDLVEAFDIRPGHVRAPIALGAEEERQRSQERLQQVLDRADVMLWHATVKDEGGQLKRILRQAFGPMLPSSIVNRTDKMGFPTPINVWAAGEARDFIRDVLTSQAALSRGWVDNHRVLEAQRVADGDGDLVGVEHTGEDAEAGGVQARQQVQPRGCRADEQSYGCRRRQEPPPFQAGRSTRRKRAGVPRAAKLKTGGDVQSWQLPGQDDATAMSRKRALT